MTASCDPSANKASQTEEHYSSPKASITDSAILAHFLESLGELEPLCVARTLLNEFGSLSDFLGASKARLRRTLGRRMTDALVSSRDLMKAALLEVARQRVPIDGPSSLLQYLRLSAAYLTHERLIAVYLDHQSNLLQTVELTDGNSAGVKAEIVTIIREGLALDAAGVILIHNHPSGNPQPSACDKDFMQTLTTLSEVTCIQLFDHLVIAGDKFWSMRFGQLLMPPEPGRHDASTASSTESAETQGDRLTLHLSSSTRVWRDRESKSRVLRHLG